MLAIGLLGAFVSQLGAFFYFLNTRYNSKLKTEFLSLDINAVNCKPVTLSETCKFYVDKYGTWDQGASYQHHESLFVVQFTGYRGDESPWATDMDALNSVIKTEMDYLRSISD